MRNLSSKFSSELCTCCNYLPFRHPNYHEPETVITIGREELERSRAESNAVVRLVKPCQE